LQESENARTKAENERQQALNARNEAERERLNALKEIDSRLSREIDEKNKRIADLENNVRQMEGENIGLQDRLRTAECNNEQLIREISENIGKKLSEDMKRNSEQEFKNLKRNMNEFNELNKENTLLKKELECKSKNFEELGKQLSAIIDLNKLKNDLNDTNTKISNIENERIHYKSRFEACKTELSFMNIRVKELILNNKLLAEETNRNINSVLSYMKLSNQNLLNDNARILNNINYSNENLKFDMHQLKNEVLIYMRNSLDAFFQNENFAFIGNSFKFLQRNIFKPFIFIFVLFIAFITIVILRYGLNSDSNIEV